MGMSNAERQAKHRSKIATRMRPIRRRPKDRRSRPARWYEAVDTLCEISENIGMRRALPFSLRYTEVGEMLSNVCDLDLFYLRLPLPKGYGRDEVDAQSGQHRRPRSRLFPPERWCAAVDRLCELQNEYRDSCASMPRWYRRTAEGQAARQFILDLTFRICCRCLKARLREEVKF